MIDNEYLWTEKYRPKTVRDTILPESIKTKFQNYVDSGNIPNLLLSGGPGIGKTTIAQAMLEEIGADYMKINASMSGNIDTLRTDIKEFASAVSFSGGRKFVLLDEADYLNAQSTQPALRSFMEEYSANCGFIFTCNYPKRIMGALADSRVSQVNFKINKADLPQLAAQIMKRVIFILETEGVEYDKKAVAEVIKKYHPDWRRVIMEIQAYAQGVGRIDAGILVNLSEENIKNLLGMLKDKKWDDMRKWVAHNSDLDANDILRQVFDKMAEYVKPVSMPGLVVTLAKYQYQSAFATDQEINLVAALTEIMVETEFK